MRKNEGIAARLPVELIEKLEAIAAKEERSLSQVVSRGLRFYVASMEAGQ